ncbi:MAG: hypothetical protein HPY44_06810 [Armatimonadetes bacterium]|nr:hypothetical protein [Armatimonadota bacterium]
MAGYAPAGLKEKAHIAIDRINAAREAGSGRFPVHELIHLFELKLPPDLERDLLKRGDLEFLFPEGSKGSFSNSGTPLSLPYGPGKLLFPREVGGQAHCDPDALHMIFDQSRTMLAKALFLEVKLLRIEISRRHVAVRLTGGLFDMEFEF